MVDLWGGYRNRAEQEPWEADTLVSVASVTKGISSLAVAVQLSRGLLALDERVCKYWPDFAQNGKQDVTIRQLLAHECGLAAVDETCDIELVTDPERLYAALAKQKMHWDTPGDHHGYMGFTLGFYESALVYFTDPQRRTIGQFLHDEVVPKAGCQGEFYLGVPSSVPESRLASFMLVSQLKALKDLDKLPPKLLLNVLFRPSSYTARTLKNPPMVSGFANDRKVRAAEYPASNGHATARALAAMYSAAERAINTQGRENAFGLSEEILSALQEVHPPSRISGMYDQVLHCPTSFNMGFCKPGPQTYFGSDSRAFGHSGCGGHHAHADPSTESSFAYVQLSEQPVFLDDDPRERALRVRAYECIAASREASGLSTVPLDHIRQPSILNEKFLRKNPKFDVH